MDKRLVCPCGLTCCDCLYYKDEIYEAAHRLKKIIKFYRFDEFLTLCSHKQFLSSIEDHLDLTNHPMQEDFEKNFMVFKQMPEFMNVLDGMLNLQCKKTCQESSGCSIHGSKHECKALKCIKANKYDGCWQCDKFEKCDKLDFLKKCYGITIEENLKIIKHKGMDAIESRGNTYYEWQRK